MSDIYDDPKVLEAAFEDLAEDLNESFAQAEDAGELNFVTLLMPGEYRVTGLTMDSMSMLARAEPGGIVLYAFIGGEDFEPASCYVERNQIMVRFKPRDASPFRYMVMSADDALVNLEGFDLVASTNSGTYSQRVDRLRAAIVKHRERAQANAERSEQYKDFDEGFGSF